MKHSRQAIPTQPARLGAMSLHWASRLATPALLAGAFVLPSPQQGTGASEGSSALIQETRDALESWVATEGLIAAEESAWREGKLLLKDRIATAYREISDVRGEIAGKLAQTAENAGKRASLVVERERIQAATKAMETTLLELESRALALLARLPDPLKEKVRFLSQQIPAAGAESKLSVALRFQNVIGLLNEVNKFHREITLTSEVRTLADGSSAEVTAIYLGISQSYYATANGLSAGTGTAGPSSWTWTPSDAEAANIALAIRILEGAGVAAFVPVPVRIQ